MRYRERTTCRDNIVADYVSPDSNPENHGFHVGTITAPSAFSDGYDWQSLPVGTRVCESFLDEVAQYKFGYKNCAHHKCEWFPDAFGYFSSPDQGGIAYWQTPASLQRVVLDYPTFEIAKRLPCTSALLRDDAVELHKKFFQQSFLPGSVTIDRDPFNSGFSVWYLLVDLWEAKGLFRELFQLARQNVGSSLGKHTLKDVADGHLGIQFGIKPTYSDVEDFCQVLRDLQNLDKLIEDINKKTERKRFGADARTTARISKDYPDIDQSRLVSIPGAEAVVTATGSWKFRYQRSVRYGFSAPEVTGFLARLRQFVEKLGVLDPAAIWDVIPFSFVVDWFVGVGKWLHANRPSVYRFDIRVLDYCESFNPHIDVNYYARMPSLDGHTMSPYYQRGHIGMLRKSTYVRALGDPSDRVVVAPSLEQTGIPRWTWRRDTIVAALLAQRMFALKSRHLSRK